MNKKRDPFLTGVFALAAAARLTFLLVWKLKGLESMFPYDPYPTVALGWLGWVPATESIFRPPLYSAVLAALFWFFTGVRDWAVPFLQCLLSACCPVLLFYWARRVGQETEARVAAVWMSVDPALIFFSPQYQTETFFIFLLICFFLSLYRALDAPADSRSFLTGITGGLASLTRGAFLAYSVFFAMAAAKMKRRRLLALVAAGWLITVAPWTIRNYHYYRAFIPISAQSGWNMYEGFTLDLNEIKRRPFDMATEVKKRHITDPIAVDRYFQQKVSRFIHQHSREAAKIVFMKMFRFWRPWPYDPYSQWVRWGLGAYFSILLSMAALGMWSLRGIAERLLPVYALFLGLTLLHALYFTSLRYRLPLEPFLCFFAAAGAVDLWARISRRLAQIPSRRRDARPPASTAPLPARTSPDGGGDARPPASTAP